MSEIAETPAPATTAATAIPTAPSRPAAHIVHEAYSFACMKCGFGWEQGYEIEHHVNGRGEPFIVYTVNSERVPSPLSNPTCMNCDGHVVRIMREGQVKSVLGLLDQLYQQAIPAIAGPPPAMYDAPRPPRQRRSVVPDHPAPGPVVAEEAEGRRVGPLARLRRRFRK
ncbi:hypothetical protein [Streptomyces sp. NPDC091259]|nr:hypothetical protein E6R62_13125 [Streptomyces sp. A1136]